MQLKFVKRWKLDIFGLIRSFIQGDEEDWAKEFATMVNVYGDCLLNIAASSARDSNQGCFFERGDLPRCYISLRIGDNKNVEHDCKPVETHPLDDIDLCPLETRGWTLQERLLSPRTVHFTRDEVVWECRTKLVSETSPFKSPHYLRLRKKLLPIQNWDQIISQYSGRNLTYEKDRLVALAGIAEAIWNQTKSEYCAGIWFYNLRQLCWQLTRPHGRVFPKRAPTWSWASFNAPCHTWTESEIGSFTLSRVLKLERPGSDNSFGDMPNAALWLSCPPLVVAKVTFPNYLTLQNGSSIARPWFSFYADDMHILYTEIYVYILKLMDKGGLFLGCTGKSQGEYERVGVWRYVGCSLEEMSFFKEIRRDSTNHARESAYVPRERHEFDDEQHVITLV
ncbi:hypothetical protein EAF04_003886 [Stromatinia cepivora]|nr:hypothetical protein EAF04_003886 [Stromatinia cepivora]